MSLATEEAQLWALRDELKQTKDRLFQFKHRREEVLHSKNPRLLRRAAEILLETAALQAKAERLEKEYHEALDKMAQHAPVDERDHFLRVHNGRPNLSLIVV